MIKVFLSYSWSNSIEADQVENLLTSLGYYVKRDIRELEYKRNIKEFMRTIGDSDFVITLISDKFLKSHNCMYEILELTRYSDYRKRISQIILNDAKIYTPHDRVKYLEYWSNKCSEIERFLKSNITELGKIQLEKDYQVCRNIEKTIYDFTTFLADELGIGLKEFLLSENNELVKYLRVNYKSQENLQKYPTPTNVAQLDNFKIGQEFYGKIKVIYNYGFFIQLHTKHGIREGLMHKDNFLKEGLSFNKVKKLFKIGDDIHVVIGDINKETKSAKQAGGLGFYPTEITNHQIFDRLEKYIGDRLQEEYLDMSGLGLSKLPQNILLMKNLKSIMFTGNNFNDMPVEFDTINTLERVFCDFKPMRALRYDYIIMGTID